MYSPGQHPRTLAEEMELSAQAGDLPKLQTQLARWEAEVADENVTPKDHLWIDPTIAEVRDWVKLRSHTDKSEPVYEFLTRLLVKAAEGNQVDTVKYMIDKRGVPIITPAIARKAMTANAFDVLEVFLEHGWNINDPAQDFHVPILGFVTHNETRVRWCLEHGADPNARNRNKSHDVPSQAGRFASVETLRLLAAYGANFACSNALQRAAEYRLKGRMEVMEWLLDEAGFPINQREFEWDPDMFRDWQGNRLGAALHFAVLSNSPERVRFLLERGSDINLRDPYGETARDWADGGGREEIIAILNTWGK
ncbi:ankyrin [Aspergillus steynii IBT 23096]|uniref:Ankyrin n=1 Tax=Aspergillus steynii IBT 23096 TaxID=1392250 RepID=A0A2I2GMA8_9EURO|nr:ankyrin [Aspergillus steynii IBT 23096]PLB54005.1 ankyrin [Aspergillus steynii IBT 23096]